MNGKLLLYMALLIAGYGGILVLYLDFSIMAENELASCVMLTYMQTSLLADAVEMFFNQTYKEKELILVDNGSTNHYDWVEQNIIKKLSEKEKSVIKHIFVSNTTYNTLGKLRNFAIQLCYGKYICFFDDDDKFSDDRLEIQINAIKKAKIDKAMNIIDRYDILFTNGNLRTPIRNDLFGSIVFTNDENVRKLCLFGENGSNSEFIDFITALEAYGYQRINLSKANSKRYDLITFVKTNMNVTKQMDFSNLIENFTDNIEKHLRNSK